MAKINSNTDKIHVFNHVECESPFTTHSLIIGYNDKKIRYALFIPNKVMNLAQEIQSDHLIGIMKHYDGFSIDYAPDQLQAFLLARFI